MLNLTGHRAGRRERMVTGLIERYHKWKFPIYSPCRRDGEVEI